MKEIIVGLIVIGVGLGQQQTINFSAPPPPPVGSVNYQVTGSPGTGSAYYWVVAKYVSGNASPKSVRAINLPSPLTVSHYVTVRWSASSGATGYDVLRTTTPNIVGGDCGCAVATNVSGTSQVDNGGSLTSYTVNTEGVAKGSMTLDNKGASPKFDFVPAISSGGTCPGSSSDGQLLFNQTGNCAGSPDFTVDYANGLVTLTATAGPALTVNGDSHSGNVIVANSTTGGESTFTTSDTDETNGAYPLVVYAKETDSTGAGFVNVAGTFSSHLYGSNFTGDGVVGVESIATLEDLGSTAGDVTAYDALVSYFSGNVITNMYGYHAKAVDTSGITVGHAAAFAAETGWPYSFYSADGFSVARGAVTAVKFTSTGTNQAGLGTVALGTVIWCSDCTVVTCAASGSGAWVFGTASGNVCPF